MAISCSTPFLNHLSNHKGLPNHTSKRSQTLSSNSSFHFPSSRPKFPCSISMSDDQSSDHGKLKLDHILQKAEKYWDDLPQPVKKFPWDKALDNFIQQLLDAVAAIIKYISAPLLAVSSLSEMSYCARERKLFFVPVPLVLGCIVAGILKGIVSKKLPAIQEADVPVHLIAVAVIFTLLKLPGPYYPYWARIFIPHFANGGLLRAFWMIYSWYRRSEKDSGAKLQ